MNPSTLPCNGQMPVETPLERRSGKGPGHARSPLEVPLVVDSPTGMSAPQPFTFGLPIPKGVLFDPSTLVLLGEDGRPIETQAAVSARWSDRSVQWLLVDTILGPWPAGQSNLRLVEASDAGAIAPRTALRVRESSEAFLVETGPARFVVPKSGEVCLDHAELADRPFELGRLRMVLTDRRGRKAPARIEAAAIECRGPVRATIRLEGHFEGRRHVRSRSRFVARLSFFNRTGLVRLDFTLHNPRRARHPGGLWDLGDPGSLLFRDLSLEWPLPDQNEARVAWSLEPGDGRRSSGELDLEIYQDSSGGENWRSPNHLNRLGRVPLSFRGYRVRHAGQEEHGLRSSPVVAVEGQGGAVALALPGFWQQFPKAIEVHDGTLRLRLFPGQFGDLHELQGGEQKTHTTWLHVGPADSPPLTSLDWVHNPARVRSTPAWYADSGAIDHLQPDAEDLDGRPEALLDRAVDERHGLAARREIIDEYGWRHYGEVFADHEQEFYEGPKPAISHYNNQYDMVLGAILQELRGGDRRWRQIHEPLARHVIDIDIYHTKEDRSAFNGGMFWFTDHYKTAWTCTHRTYSRHNAKGKDRSYGGGPSSGHNFSTGVLFHYYLTGDPSARDAVVELAEWVLALDDGTLNVLSLVDDGSTGMASVTVNLDDPGPGRGAGNSINTLLDGWLLTHEAKYIRYAEILIRRCVHPADDIEARGLLNAEKHWSYTVFLCALDRYLRLKAEAGQLDAMYAYAQESLLAYARWMLVREKPYFDRREELQYITEAWPGQELRKANVLRLAAAHADDDLRLPLLRKADELADRAWDDLEGFESRDSARAIALVMVEGLVDAYHRRHPPRVAPRPSGRFDMGDPTHFVGQKTRVLSGIRSVRTLAGFALRLLNPSRWRKYAGRMAEHRHRSRPR